MGRQRTFETPQIEPRPNGYTRRMIYTIIVIAVVVLAIIGLLALVHGRA